MSKQDRQGVRTAPDLERKYDFGQISSVRGLTAKQEQALNQMQQSISQYIADTNAKIGELNGIIDGLNARIDELNNSGGNIDINEQTPTYTAAATEQELTSGEKISVAFGKIAKAISSFISHLKNKENPHEVTLSQVGGIYTVGDTFTMSSYATLNGHITTSSTQLYIFLPLSKKIDIAKVTGATVTSLTATIRGVKGYVGSSGTNFADGYYTFWCKPFENGVLIRITNSEAFSNATNNTPIAAQINALSLQFT